MRRVLMVVLLILLAGCSGLNGGAPSTRTTDTPSPVQTTTASPSDNVPADATPENTVNYTTLSAVEKQAFDAARRGEIGFAPEFIRESPYINRTYFPMESKEVFQNHKYVQKNGSYFRFSWELGPAIATYSIRATEQQPTENTTIVAVGNLSSQVREPVQKAIKNGSYNIPPGKWDSLPEELDGVDYVRDSETYYKITIVFGDFRLEQMSAEPVK